jgi:hypothetical protein
MAKRPCPCGCGRQLGTVKRGIAQHGVDLRHGLPFTHRWAEVCVDVPEFDPKAVRMERHAMDFVDTVVSSLLMYAHGELRDPIDRRSMMEARASATRAIEAVVTFDFEFAKSAAANLPAAEIQLLPPEVRRMLSS